MLICLQIHRFMSVRRISLLALSVFSLQSRLRRNKICFIFQSSISSIQLEVGKMWDQWDTLTKLNLGKQHLPAIAFFSFSHCGSDILVRCFTCVVVADNNCSNVWLGKTLFYWFLLKKVGSVSFQFWLVTKTLKWMSYILGERMTSADCTGRIVMWSLEELANDQSTCSNWLLGNLWDRWGGDNWDTYFTSWTTHFNIQSCWINYEGLCKVICNWKNYFLIQSHFPS